MAQAVSSTGSGRLPVAAWALLYGQRVARKLTQAAAAKECDVSQQTFSGWEQKRNRPRKRSWTRLATFLGITEADLIVELNAAFPYY